MPFSEVVGHSRPLDLLSRSIARGSLPPSLLFTGPEGVGKRLVARAVAQALNCLSPVGTAVPEARRTREPKRSKSAAATPPLAGGAETSVRPFDACGTCTACRRIARGAHPDVVWVEVPETGAIKIEPIREVVAAAGYRPFEGRRRVVVLDDADRLTPDAQDALLKSLEEPSASTVFVLITAMPETLLPTVRSRCSRLRFGRLSAAEVARLLVERHRYDEEEAFAAAAVADGSPGRALEAASRAFREAREAAIGALRIAAAARSSREKLDAANTLLAGKSTSARERDELATRVSMLASLLRDVALLSDGGPADELANRDLHDELRDFAVVLGVRRAIQAFSAADCAIGALARNANPKVVADWLAVRL